MFCEPSKNIPSNAAPDGPRPRRVGARIAHIMTGNRRWPLAALIHAADGSRRTRRVLRHRRLTCLAQHKFFIFHRQHQQQRGAALADEEDDAGDNVALTEHGDGPSTEHEPQHVVCAARRALTRGRPMGSSSRTKMYNVVVCAAAFFGMFFGFVPAASIQPASALHALPDPAHRPSSDAGPWQPAPGEHRAGDLIRLLCWSQLRPRCGCDACLQALGSLVAIPVIHRIGSKYALFAGASKAGTASSHSRQGASRWCCTWLPTSSPRPACGTCCGCAMMRAGTVIAASALNGYGASLLWVTQGLWVTENSTPATQGRNGGLFWSVSPCTVIAHLRQDHLHAGIRARQSAHLPRAPRRTDHHRPASPGACIGLTRAASQAQKFFVILTLVSAAGWLLLLGTRRLHAATPSKVCMACAAHSPHPHRQSSLISQRELSGLKFVVDTVKLLFTREMLVYLPFLFYTGAWAAS